MADPNRDWEKTPGGKPYYTVFKNEDQPAQRPVDRTGQPEKWDAIPYKTKRDMAIHALGTAKGRNLISSAIEFFLKHAEMDKRDRDIAEMFRSSLFNCNPVTVHKVRKEKDGAKAN